MRSIQIITDSMTDMPKELIEAYDIEVIPLTVHFGESEYRDGVDLSPEEFYGKLSDARELPKTSQVTPYSFEEVFKKHLEEGNEVLCINGSSRASGTHQSALLAKSELDSDKVQVFDTMGLCFGAGFFVYEAAKLAKEGVPSREILATLNNMLGKVDHIFTVDTMEYLKKGGRLNPVKAVIGGLLNLKPILTVNEGLVEPLDKVRGSKKVIGKMIELAKERGGNFSEKSLCIAHAVTPEQAAILEERVREELNPKEIIITEIGCTIGTHAGPGTLSIFYMKE